MKTNTWFLLALQGSAVIASSVLLFILVYIFKESWPIIQSIGPTRFFSDPSWYPVNGQFSLTPMLIGTLYVSLGSVLLAAPLGIVVGIYGQYYAPKSVQRVYRPMVELLAGVPSVVFGFWGLTVLVPLIVLWIPPGASVLAAIIVLAMMIIPLVILTTDAALASVPDQYIKAARALGLSRWGTIQRVALPVALPGIVSGIILQSGRAIGETMAVLMVVGNVVQIPMSLFEPARTLTTNIALEMAYAIDDHRLALFVSGLLLLFLSIALVLMANWFKGRIYVA